MKLVGQEDARKSAQRSPKKAPGAEGEVEKPAVVVSKKNAKDIPIAAKKISTKK